MKPGDRVRLTSGHTGYLIKIEDGVAWIAGQYAQVPTDSLAFVDGDESSEQYCDRCAGLMDTTGPPTPVGTPSAGGAEGN